MKPTGNPPLQFFMHLPRLRSPPVRGYLLCLLFELAFESHSLRIFLTIASDAVRNRSVTVTVHPSAGRK